jgi:hypothetical protein
MVARFSALSVVALLTCTTAYAADADPCAGYTWNVTAERALFAGSAQPAMAGKDAASGPALKAGRLYELTLAPEGRVRFRVTPGKKGKTEAGFAGLARLHVMRAGSYRVALDQASWVDVVGGEKLIPSGSFAGQHGCSAPRKIVQFDLPAGDLLLQISGVANERVRLTVTAAPLK